jgi:hypothetical protein
MSHIVDGYKRHKCLCYNTRHHQMRLINYFLVFNFSLRTNTHIHGHKPIYTHSHAHLNLFYITVNEQHIDCELYKNKHL